MTKRCTERRDTSDTSRSFRPRLDFATSGSATSWDAELNNLFSSPAAIAGGAGAGAGGGGGGVAGATGVTGGEEAAAPSGGASSRAGIAAATAAALGGRPPSRRGLASPLRPLPPPPRIPMSTLGGAGTSASGAVVSRRQMNDAIAGDDTALESLIDAAAVVEEAHSEDQQWRALGQSLVEAARRAALRTSVQLLARLVKYELFRRSLPKVPQSSSGGGALTTARSSPLVPTLSANGLNMLPLRGTDGVPSDSRARSIAPVHPPRRTMRRHARVRMRTLRRRALACVPSRRARGPTASAARVLAIIAHEWHVHGPPVRNAATVGPR